MSVSAGSMARPVLAGPRPIQCNQWPPGQRHLVIIIILMFIIIILDIIHIITIINSSITSSSSSPSTGLAPLSARTMQSMVRCPSNKVTQHVKQQKCKRMDGRIRWKVTFAFHSRDLSATKVNGCAKRLSAQQQQCQK